MFGCQICSKKITEFNDSGCCPTCQPDPSMICEYCQKGLVEDEMGCLYCPRCFPKPNKKYTQSKEWLLETRGYF